MKSTRCCSQCGSNGHNSRTCRLPVTSPSSSATTPAAPCGGIMLFGVRIGEDRAEDRMRKIVSMSDLTQYQHVDDIPAKVSDAAGVAEDAATAAVKVGGDDLTAAAVPTGYASADEAVAHLSPAAAAARERKRGVPWTEEEHKLFLMGLEKVGKGDWRGISRNFVKTRTPTQVASHSQKYYLRKNNLNRRRRRSSLFDISLSNTVPVKPLEEQPKQEHRDETSVITTVTPAPSVAENSGMNTTNGYGVAPFSVSVGPYYMPVQVQNHHPHGNMPVSFVHPVQVPMFTIPSASPSAINLNQRMMMVNQEPSPMSWKLSLPSSSSKPSSDQSYRAGSYKGGDGFITVS